MVRASKNVKVGVVLWCKPEELTIDHAKPAAAVVKYR